MSLTEEVIRKLKYQILSGQYEPGEHLPTLREMADIFEVSRSVINAVVVDMETSGYIKIVPTKWIEVADWETEGNLSILNDLIEFDLIKREQLESLLQSRLFMELECVRLACGNASREDVARLKALVIEESAETRPEKRAKCDIRFHTLVAQMSGNFIYGMIINSFSDSGRKLIEKFYNDENVMNFVSEKHGSICRAIENKDVNSAVAEMRELLLHGERIIYTKIK